MIQTGVIQFYDPKNRYGKVLTEDGHLLRFRLEQSRKVTSGEELISQIQFSDELENIFPRRGEQIIFRAQPPNEPWKTRPKVLEWGFLQRWYNDYLHQLGY